MNETNSLTKALELARSFPQLLTEDEFEQRKWERMIELGGPIIQDVVRTGRIELGHVIQGVAAVATMGEKEAVLNMGFLPSKDASTWKGITKWTFEVLHYGEDWVIVDTGFRVELRHCFFGYPVTQAISSVDDALEVIRKEERMDWYEEDLVTLNTGMT